MMKRTCIFLFLFVLFLSFPCIHPSIGSCWCHVQIKKKRQGKKENVKNRKRRVLFGTVRYCTTQAEKKEGRKEEGQVVARHGDGKRDVITPRREGGKEGIKNDARAARRCLDNKDLTAWVLIVASFSPPLSLSRRRPLCYRTHLLLLEGNSRTLLLPSFLQCRRKEKRRNEMLETIVIAPYHSPCLSADSLLVVSPYSPRTCCSRSHCHCTRAAS